MTRRLSATALTAALFVGALVLPVAGARSGPAAASSVAGLEAGVLERLNDVRREHGLPALVPNAQLAAAARKHSFEMVERGYFSHRSADGSEHWERIQKEYPRRGFSHWTVSENLLWASPTIRPGEALRVWMESPGHRKAILSRAWREIGVAAVRSPAAPGAFHGGPVTVITIDFGARR